MTSAIPALQRKRVHMWLGIIAVSAVIGALYGMFLGVHFGLTGVRTRSLMAAFGVLHGVLIGGGISAIEIFLPGVVALRRVLDVPLLALVGLKTLAYGGIVIAVHAGAPGPRLLLVLLDRTVRLEEVTGPAPTLTVGLALGAALIFVLTMQFGQLLGFRTARDLFLGRYRRPRHERRFFLFVDVVGSTAVAERLGPLQAHRFLSAVFDAAAEPIAASRGEVYQYVGDEIVVTWTEPDGVGGEPAEARPVRCFFDMELSLGARAEEFRKVFGTEPQLRGALHLGEVIAGEVGVWRRAIVFHGDVMNTTSRLEQATRETGQRFIASADALRALGSITGFGSRDLGAIALRGRREPLHAYGIERETPRETNPPRSPNTKQAQNTKGLGSRAP
jgi:adenylate cyclase